MCRAFAVKDEVDDCIATLTALDETLARLRSKLESLRAAQASSSLSETPQETVPPFLAPSDRPVSAASALDVAGSEPLAKKRKLEPAQGYADLRRSTDVKKAKRLITARENSIKAVQKLLDKETSTNNAALAVEDRARSTLT